MADEKQPRVPAWLPIAIAVAGFASAAVFSRAETDPLRRLTGGGFSVAIGTALLLWGLRELGQGSIRGRRVRVRRSEYPVTFWSLLAIKRIVPGVVMLVAGLWYAFLRTPT